MWQPGLPVARGFSQTYMSSRPTTEFPLKMPFERVDSAAAGTPLVLDGEDLELQSLLVDGKTPATADLLVDASSV